MHSICRLLTVLFILAGKAVAQAPTLVIHNANVYTMNPDRPTAQAIVITYDRIVFVGSDIEAKRYIQPETKVIDGKGSFVMPGLIEGHGHIHGMGASLISLNLMKARNWEEIVRMVADAARKAKPGDWIIGRGWHQEKWDKSPSRQFLGYPYHADLDKVSPNNPVLLTHASGHSSYVNALALQQAGITEKTPDPPGGAIVKDGQGNLVGVLEETAQTLANEPFRRWVEKRPIADRKAEWQQSIALAEQECLRQGITTFVDAGSSFEQVEWMREMAQAGKFAIRHWVMVRSNLNGLYDHAGSLPLVDLGKGHLTVRAIKVSLDGALGSYGAWLLQPYADRPGFLGQNTFPVPELRQIAQFAWQRNLQLCVHAIGDKANRETLDIFADQIRKNPAKDHRWRIEHAQHVHPSDIPRFRQWNSIASMQGIHCTSDAPYVPRRLGDTRSAEGAYMWRAFLDQGVLVNNGTDVPVEDIDPFVNLHASVTRKLKDGSRFYPEQKMSRAEALYSYTMANARAAFEEKNKGSIETGKLADLVMLSNDLLNCADDDIPNTKVLMTIVGGKIRYTIP